MVHIAANALKNYYSRDLHKLSKQISLEDWVESYGLQHEEDLACPYKRLENAAWIDDLFDHMKRCCTQVECGVIGMYYRGQTFDEISILTGMNSATVRGHFLRGRRKLLVQALVDAPHLLGGTDAVLAAVESLEAGQPGLLTNQEREGLRSRSGSAELLRSAMQKIAPYLEGLR